MKTVPLPDKSQVAGVAILDEQGRVLTPGRLMDSTGRYSFDTSALPKAYTYDGANVATTTYGPDSNGRSFRVTNTYVGGVKTAESAPVLVGTAAAGLALSGAAAAIVGTLSGDISVSVTPAGAYFSPFTFTPSDNGAGGTFAPASVELSFASPSATFKYTPAAEGAKQLSGTVSQGGLPSPAALAFTGGRRSMPLAVGSVYATTYGRTVTLNWAPLSAGNTGGAPVTGYIARLTDGSAKLLPADTTSYTFTDVKPGVTVSGMVAPVTVMGAGDFKASGSCTPSDTPRRGFTVIGLLGQSNVDGRGDPVPAIDTADPKVFQFDCQSTSATYCTIIPAIDPLKHPEPLANKTGVGPGMAWAKAYAKRTGEDVLLVPLAWGGTSLTIAGSATWSAGATDNRDSANAIAKLNLAMAAAKAVHPDSQFGAWGWIQGEGDAQSFSVAQGVYTPGFVALANLVRSSVTGAAHAPIIIGQMLPEGIAVTAGEHAIDQAHKQIAATLENCAFATVGPGYSLGDNLHYNAAGARKMGAAMDQALASLVNIGVPNAPTDLTAGLSEPTAQQLTWNLPYGSGPLTDFAIRYALTGTGNWTTFPDGVSAEPFGAVTGLIPGTTYDYRVAGIYNGQQGPWSNTITATTAPAVVQSNVRLTALTLLTESGDAVAGWNYVTPAGAGAFTTHHAGASDKKVAANTAGGFQIKFTDVNVQWMFGIVTTQTDPAYNTGDAGYKYAVYNGSTELKLKLNGSATAAAALRAALPAAGDILRYRRTADGQWYLELARAAAPLQFVMLHAFAVLYAGDAYCALAVTNNAGVGKVAGPLTGWNVV